MAEDISVAYQEIAKKFYHEQASILLGFHERYPHCKLHESFKPSWLNRILAYPGKIIILDDLELLDFLKKAKSTYAIFEILIDGPPRIIKMNLQMGQSHAIIDKCNELSTFFKFPYNGDYLV